MRFSKIISIIFHPIFIPLLIFYLTINYINLLQTTIVHNLSLIYIIILVFTIILPLASTYILVFFNKISSLEIHQKEERFKPLIISAIWGVIGFFYLSPFLIFNPILKTFYLSFLFLISLASLISIFWKISLHMIGMGATTGFFIVLNILYKDATFLIVAFFLLSGLVGFARLKEGAHSKKEVYTGFILGCLLELLLFFDLL